MNFSILQCLPWLLAATVTINWQARHELPLSAALQYRNPQAAFFRGQSVARWSGRWCHVRDWWSVRVQAATQCDVGSSTCLRWICAPLQVSSPARSVHDRWPFDHQFHDVGFLRTCDPEDLPAHEFQHPPMSPLVARSHRHYKLANLTNIDLVNPCRLAPAGW